MVQFLSSYDITNRLRHTKYNRADEHQNFCSRVDKSQAMISTNTCRFSKTLCQAHLTLLNKVKSDFLQHEVLDVTEIRQIKCRGSVVNKLD